MKKIFSLFLSFVVVISICSYIPIEANAKTQLFKKTFDLSIDSEFEDYSFEIDKAGVIYFDVELSVDFDDAGYRNLKKLDGNYGIKLNLYSDSIMYSDIHPNEEVSYENDYEIEPNFDDTFSFKLDKNYYKQSYWYCTDKIVPANTYYLSGRLLKDNALNEFTKCTITAYRYDGYVDSINLKKSYSVDMYSEKIISSKEFCADINNRIFVVNNIKKPKSINVSYTPKGIYIYSKKPGKYKIDITLNNDKIYSIIINVKKKIKLDNTSIELPVGSSKKITLLSANKNVKWSSSNSKVATVDKNGKIVAKKSGKCTITAKYKNKKYNCKVKSFYLEPNFVSCLYDYNTRDNYFVVKFKNYGDKTITIKPTNAKCMDVDYKSYDRKLHLPKKKSVKIKPNTTKYIKFYVEGRTTWHDYEDFTIRYYFSYCGKKYLGSVWDEDSVYKKGKKWFTTYWCESDEEYFALDI